MSVVPKLRQLPHHGPPSIKSLTPDAERITRFIQHHIRIYKSPLKRKLMLKGLP
jgi:hypothetical protein